MLSIGKLAVGQADYYLDQALGSVTRAGAVSSGVEDYYLSGHEAPGVWIGAGSRALGLGGEIDAVRLSAELAQREPVGAEAEHQIEHTPLTEEPARPQRHAQAAPPPPSAVARAVASRA